MSGEYRNCGVCTRVCPIYESSATKLENFVFGRKGKPEEEFGVYKRALVTRSTDEEILRKSQDGGVITTLLSSALESGLVDGAITSGTDSANPWLPSPFVVTT